MQELFEAAEGGHWDSLKRLISLQSTYFEVINTNLCLSIFQPFYSI